MTVRIYLRHVKRIYDRQVGAGQLRDEGLLEGAVNAPFQEVFGAFLQLNGQVIDYAPAVDVDEFIRGLESRDAAESHAAEWLNQRMRGMV